MRLKELKIYRALRDRLDRMSLTSRQRFAQEERARIHAWGDDDEYRPKTVHSVKGRGDVT